MKTYRDIKRRMLALVVAFATALSGFSFGTTEVSAEESRDRVENGDSIAQVFRAACPEGYSYVKLQSVSLKLHALAGQSIRVSATIHRNIPDSSTPTSPTDVVTEASVLPENGTEGIIETDTEATKTVTVTPKEDIYLTGGEDYAVVITLESADGALYVSENGDGGYTKSAEDGSSWMPISGKIMSAVTTGANTGDVKESFEVSLAPKNICMDKNDIADGNASFQFQSTISPAYKRSVKYSMTGDDICSVTENGQLTFKTPAALGSAEICAAVEGDKTKGYRTAKVTVVEASLSKSAVTYTGKACEPEVTFNSDVDKSGFTYAYANQVQAGKNTASVTITGKPGTAYEGYSHVLNYTIEPLKIEQAQVDKATFVIDTTNDTVKSATITVRSTTLSYNENVQDFNVEAQKTGIATVNGKLNYTYTVKVSGKGNSTTDGVLTTTVNAVVTGDSSGKIDISSVMEITLNKTKYTYTGKEIIPSYTAKVAGTEVKATDYATVTGSTNAGKAMVTFVGTGNYTGTITEEFTIEKASMSRNASSFEFTVAKDSTTGKNIYIKTGQPIEPEVEVKFSDDKTSLVNGVDYTVEYQNSINVGMMTVNIIGKGNFTGTYASSYKIVGDFKKDALWTIEGMEADDAFHTEYAATFNADEIKPETVGEIAGTQLEEDKDYELEYRNNINAGTAEVLVTGKNDYEGQSVTLTFSIKKAPLPDTVAVTADKTWIYTGKPIALESTDYSLGSLREGVDYEISYDGSDNVNAGRVKITATAREDSNYTGKSYGYFRISPRDISVEDEKMHIEVGSVVYNSFPQKPEVLISYDGVVIGEENYTLTATDNINVGTGTVTVEGTGNLSGTVSKPFTISPRSFTHLEWNVGGAGYTDNTDSGYKAEYNGVTQKPNIELRDGETLLKAGKDYTVISYSNSKLPGTAAATITWLNGYSTNPNISVQFEITEKNIGREDAGIKITYNGNKEKDAQGRIFPDISVVDQGLKSGLKTLEEGVDFELVASEKEGKDYDLTTSGGTKKALIKGKGYYTGETEVTFAIGNSLETGDYYITLKNPHTGEVVSPDTDDGISRFFYLGEGVANRPQATLYYKNPTTSEVVEMGVGDVDVTYTSSIDDGKINSVWTQDNQNVVTVAYEGKDRYYGRVVAKYLLKPVGIGGEINKVISVTSKALGTFQGVTCEVPYTGNAIDEAAVLKDLKITYHFSDTQSMVLTDEDYTVEMHGTATQMGETVDVKIIGKGNYNGYQTFTYKIVQRDIGNCTIAAAENGKVYNYTGEPILPTIAVWDPVRNCRLEEGIDYEISCNADRTMPGRKEFQIVGKGNYTGTLTKDANGNPLYYAIDAKVLSEDTVKIENFHPTWKYSGNMVKQIYMYIIYVDDGSVSIPLEEHKDYEVSYNPEDPVDPGIVTMTVTGKGVYTGSLSRTYYIQEEMAAVDVKYDATKQYVVDTNGNLTNFDASDFVISYNNNQQILKINDDYVIDTSECTTPGKHNVVFKGIGKYTGQIVKEILVYGDLSQATIKGLEESYVYNGQPVGPNQVVVNYGTDFTVPASDYILTRSNDTAVGTKSALLTVTPKADTFYLTDKTKQESYSIYYDLREMYTQLKIESATFTYNGTEQMPNIEVSCITDRAPLTKGIDYTVEYANNKNAGTASITINAVDGRSVGSQTRNFTIEQVDISKATVRWKTGVMPLDETLTYTADPQKPEIIVEADGKELTPDVDYEVIYKDNINVGQATVTVVGKGNCKGSAAPKTFTIAPASLNESLNPNINMTVADTFYNKGTAAPEVTVMFHGKKLTEGSDYDCTVSCPGVAKGGIMYPTRDARVTIQPHTGNGNFVDSWEETFEIKAINLNDSATVSLEKHAVEYAGKVIEGDALNITVSCNMVGQTEPYTLVKGTDYTITQLEATPIKNVGTYRIKVEGIKGFTGAWDLPFEVTPRSIAEHTKVTYESEHMPYLNGAEVEPQVTAVTEKGLDAIVDEQGKPVTLKEGVDYMVSYENNTMSASKDDENIQNRPTMIISGIGNYAGSEQRIYFDIGDSIEGAHVTLSVPTGGYIYNGAVQKPDLAAVTLNGKQLIKDTDFQLLESEDDFINAGKKHIKIKGIGAYYGVANGEYTIEKTTETSGIHIKMDGITYNRTDDTYSAIYTGNEIIPEITVYDYAISKNKALTAGDDYRVDIRSNTNVGTASVYINLDKNYAGDCIKTIFFTIAPFDISNTYEIALENKEFDYEAREIIPELEVKSRAGEKVPALTLREISDYKISSLENNVCAGKDAKLTVTGVGNYTGTLTAEFMIKAALDDTNTDFTRIDIEEQFYTGKEAVPVVKIHCGGNDLVQGEDFSVQNVWDAENPYLGQAIITPLREYYTSVAPIVLPYTMAYGAKYLRVTGYANEYTYNGRVIKPNFRITDLQGNEVSKELLHYDASKITYVNEKGKNDCVNVGTITATIPVYIADKEPMLLKATYRIIPKNINSCTISKVNTNTYNGKSIEPAVAIVYNGHELVRNQEYTIRCTDNVNPGTAKVNLKGTGNYTGECSLLFRIVPAKMINLKAQSVSDTSIKLSWTKNAKVTGYVIYSADGKKTYGKTKNNYFTVKKLKAATKYGFLVRSYVTTASGKTTYGDAARVYGNTKLAKVSVKLKSTQKKKVTASWKKQTAIDGYQIYRSTSKKGKFKKIAVVPEKKGSYTDKKVKSKKKYYYKVRAYKKVNGGYSYGDFSKTVSVKVK